MFASSFHTKETLKRYPEAIQKALTFLKDADWKSLKDGEYEIQGRDIYAQVFHTTTAPAEEKKPEFHKIYIEVQYLIEGAEQLGYVPDCLGLTVASEEPDRDLYFYQKVENESYIHAKPGCFTIFFPEDVHRPAVAEGEPAEIRKAVVKVKAELC